MADDARARLAGQLSAVMGGVRIDDLRRLSGGASRETWTFAGLYNAGQIGALRVHPTDPNTAWVSMV